uniref:Uncharacterized protein n=1 Tax=Physcomitrium patens TaxID=3218 RepID=A0A2K1IF36_PHYPA|nr:hypothetical protein PHYPA_028488 [Physcomitrium patens]
MESYYGHIPWPLTSHDTQGPALSVPSLFTFYSLRLQDFEMSVRRTCRAAMCRALKKIKVIVRAMKSISLLRRAVLKGKVERFIRDPFMKQELHLTSFNDEEMPTPNLIHTIKYGDSFKQNVGGVGQICYAS